MTYLKTTFEKKARQCLRHVAGNHRKRKSIMTQLSIITQAIITMSSPEIAELTGKKLGHVNRDIRIMLDDLKDEPKLDHQFREEKDARGYTTAFHLDRELTDTLLTGYSAVMRRKVVARWHELEAKVAKPAALSRMDILQLAMESEQARIQAEAERDHAIATKAQIGDKKVATAMATASAKSREVTRLKHELGYSQHHATILQVESKLGREFDFHPLRRWCNLNKVAPDTVPDKRYPNGVKAWPAGAWANVYGVDLVELFGEVAA